MPKFVFLPPPSETMRSWAATLAEQVPELDVVVASSPEDVEREMSKLAETQIMYNAVGQLAASKFGVLRTAINEGRR